MTPAFRVVNRSVPRSDGKAKVTGRAAYASDLRLNDMAYAWLLRSPIAHARIRSIDVRAAAELPGVVATLTGEDCTGLDPYYGHAAKDHPLIAIGKVRYTGEPVAAVVAETPLIAREAIEAITVDYDPLPTVMTAEEAMVDGASRVHEMAAQPGASPGFEGEERGTRGLNVCQYAALEWGDVDEAFAEAARVVEGKYRFPMAYAYAMEPYVAIAEYRDDGLLVYTSAQHPYMVRHDLADVFRLPLSRVRVVVPHVGGGYGSKSYTKIEPLASACSWKARRPVKLQLSVEEAMLTTRSDDATITLRTAADGEGRLLAREATIVMDTGAYAENSPLVITKAVNRIVGPYRFPSVRVRGYAVYTNTTPASSFRGFGAPQVTFAGESQMDELAHALDMTPFALRVRSIVPRGERLLPKLRPLDADVAEDLRKAWTWISAPARTGRGRGVALSASDAGASPLTSAIVRLLGDGSVVLLTGSTEIGQGSHTVLAQIAAEELGVEFDHVAVVSSDTAITPFERSTGASRTTTLMGRAVLEACRDVISQVHAIAADVLAAAPARLRPVPGGIAYKGRVHPWSEILGRYFGATDCEIVGRAHLRQAGEFAELPVFWEIGCAGVEVSVDRDTGQVAIDRLVTVGDVGLAINPAMTEGQDLGAAVMGMGLGLFEELRYDGQQLANGTMLSYRVPRASDVPPDIALLLTENRDGVGPYGAKGSGEGSLNPIAAAVANAVFDATGARVREAPLTPERVWRALRAQ